MIPYDLPEALKTRCAALDELLSNHRRIGIAFSGGVDSTLLAWYVHVVLERRSIFFLLPAPCCQTGNAAGPWKPPSKPG